jgi:hypothetical protein
MITNVDGLYLNNNFWPPTTLKVSPTSPAVGIKRGNFSQYYIYRAFFKFTMHGRALSNVADLYFKREPTFTGSFISPMTLSFYQIADYGTIDTGDWDAYLSGTLVGTLEVASTDSTAYVWVPLSNLSVTPEDVVAIQVVSNLEGTQFGDVADSRSGTSLYTGVSMEIRTS